MRIYVVGVERSVHTHKKIKKKERPHKVQEKAQCGKEEICTRVVGREHGENPHT